MIEIWKTLCCVFMALVMGTGLAKTAEAHEFIGMLLFGMAFAFWTNLSLLRIFGDH